MARNRAVTFISGASVMLLLWVPTAGADAPANSNNCLGAGFSALVPEETSTAPPTYGKTTRAQAQAGTRAELLTGATEAAASCGTP